MSNIIGGISIFIMVAGILVIIKLAKKIESDYIANIPEEVKECEKNIKTLDRCISIAQDCLFTARHDLGFGVDDKIIVKNFEQGNISLEQANEELKALSCLRAISGLYPTLLNDTKKQKNQQLKKLEQLYEQCKIKKKYRQYDISNLESVVDDMKNDFLEDETLYISEILPN